MTYTDKRYHHYLFYKRETDSDDIFPGGRNKRSARQLRKKYIDAIKREKPDGDIFL
jgi:hypothetical protein